MTGVVVRKAACGARQPGAPWAKGRRALMGEDPTGLSLDMDLAEVLGVIADSPRERRRLRLLDATGQEIASVAGVIVGPDWAGEEGERFAEFRVGDREMSVRVKILLDADTHCTINPDSTMTCTLPSGATWTTTPLRIEDRGDGAG